MGVVILVSSDGSEVEVTGLLGTLPQHGDVIFFDNEYSTVIKTEFHIKMKEGRPQSVIHKVILG